MKLTRRWRYFSALVFSGIILGALFVWYMGGVLVAPANHPIGNPPPELHPENVEFPSASGAIIHGWFISGEAGKGAVVLMHGVHANREALITRAEFLSQAGYSLLLFDFQAHGESLGKQITFGYLESRDATAAVNFVHQKLPGEKVGVIGISMGAASALLARPPLPVDAMILESCYPTIYQATEDRMMVRFGWLGKWLTPLLTCQLKPRLGISLDDLKPLESAGKFWRQSSSSREPRTATQPLPKPGHYLLPQRDQNNPGGLMAPGIRTCFDSLRSNMRGGCWNFWPAICDSACCMAGPKVFKANCRARREECRATSPLAKAARISYIVNI